MRHDDARTTRYTLPGDRVFPESIGYDPATGDFYVGSLEDGAILRGNIDRDAADVFLPAGGDGRTSAAGIKVDARGRLFVAGGSTGKAWVYDARSARLLATVDAGPAALINDIAILANGDAYVTDSLNPVIYKIRDADGARAFEPWLTLTGTVVSYQEGLNLNGIAASADGRYLIVGQTNAGKLFRVDIENKEVAEIRVGDEPLVHCDGILLDGRTLYVARNAENLLVTIHLAPDLQRGRVASSATDPAYRFPTALAKAGDRLLVVNAQLDRMAPGAAPDLPFTVLGVAASA